MNDHVPAERLPAQYGFVDTLSLGLKMATLDERAVDESVSTRMGLLWPILLGVVGGVANPGLINPLAWVGLAVMGTVSFFLMTGYCHLVSQLFGGRGSFDDLLKGAGTGSLVRLGGVIPILGWFASVWYAVILVKVLCRVYGYGLGSGVAVIALPMLLILVGSALLFFGVLTMGVFGSM